MNYLASTHSNTSNHSIVADICNGIRITSQLCKPNFSKSNVYHKESKQNVLDDSVRSSKTHKIYYRSSKTIFYLVEKLIDQVNKTNNTLFSLVPDDIDIIKYDKGDFFNRHDDYVPIKNKYIKYYTLLFCIDANCVGGETSLFMDKGEIKFTESITPGQWLLFKNEIEHSGNKIESGYKIILKANVINIDFGTNMHYAEFDKLISAKNDIISKFLESETGTILPIYSLADYLFYRNCFKHNSNIVPFQFITANGNGTIDLTIINDNKPIEADIFSTGLSKAAEKIFWFNIHNNCPIIYYKTPKSNNEDSDDEDSDDENSSENINSFVKKYIYDNLDINEIERAISLMISCFWSISISYNDEETNGPILDFDNKNDHIGKLIIEKIKENLSKVHAQEKNAFNLSDIDRSKQISDYRDKFTNKFISDIHSKYTTGTINYKTGGTYYCNETNYFDFQTDIYFGFAKME